MGSCICIPLKNADIVQKDRVSFEVKIDCDRCWHFNVMTLEILQKWLNLLTKKHVDYSRFEESYSNLPMPRNYSHEDTDDKKEEQHATISPYFKSQPFASINSNKIQDYNMKEIEDEKESASESENGDDDDGNGKMKKLNLSVDMNASKNKLSWNSAEDQDEFQHGLGLD